MDTNDDSEVVYFQTISGETVSSDKIFKSPDKNWNWRVATIIPSGAHFILAWVGKWIESEEDREPEEIVYIESVSNEMASTKKRFDPPDARHVWSFRSIIANPAGSFFFMIWTGIRIHGIPDPVNIKEEQEKLMRKKPPTLEMKSKEIAPRPIGNKPRSLAEIAEDNEKADGDASNL